jgi:hypothetical protein
MKRLTFLFLMLLVHNSFAVGLSEPIYSGSIETNKTVFIPQDPFNVRFPIRRAYVQFPESDYYNSEFPYAQVHLEYPVGYCLERMFISCPSDTQILPNWGYPGSVEAPVGTRITVRIVSGATGQPLDRALSGLAANATFGNGTASFTMDFADARIQVGGVIIAKALARLEVALELKRIAAIQLAELRRRLLRVNDTTYPGIESQNPPPATLIENSPSALELLALFKQWRKDAAEAGLSGDEIPVQSAVVFVQERKSLTVDGGIVGALFGQQTVTLERLFHPYILIRIPVPNRSLSQGTNPSLGLGWFTVRLYEWKRQLDEYGNPAGDSWGLLSLSSEPKPNWEGNAGTLFDNLMERTRALTEEHSLSKSIRAVIQPMVFPGGYNPESITQYLQSDYELLEAQRNQAATEFLANLVPMYDAAQKIADGESVQDIVLSATVDAAGLGVGTKSVVKVLGKKIYTDAVARTALKTAAAYKVGRTIVRARDSIQKNGLTAWVMLSVAADVVDLGLTGINAYEGLADIKKWRAMKQLADASSEVRPGLVAEGLGDAVRGQSVKIAKDSTVVPTGLGGPSVSDKPLPSTLGLSVPGAVRQVCEAPGNLFRLGAKKLKTLDDYIYQSLRHVRAVDRGLKPIGREKITAKPLGNAQTVTFDRNYDNIAEVQRLSDEGLGLYPVSPDEILRSDRVKVKDAKGNVYTGLFDKFTPAGRGRSMVINTGDGVVNIPLIQSNVLVHRLELEIQTDAGVKTVEVFIPALADGKPDQEMVEWVQDAFSYMPGELIPNNATVDLYSGKQGTTGQYGIRFYQTQHSRQSMDDAQAFAGLAEIGNNHFDVFPNGLSSNETLRDFNERRRLYKENLVPANVDFKEVWRSETVFHEAGHLLSAEIVKKVTNAEIIDLKVRQQFTDLFQSKLEARGTYKFSGVSWYASSFIDNYLSTYGLDHLANPGKWRLAMEEVFAETVRLRIMHEIDPLSREKLSQMKPFFDTLDEMIDAHCSEGFFDAFMKSFRGKYIPSNYMTITAGRMLSKAAQAANEPDAEEAKFGVYSSETGPMGIFGFKDKPVQGAVTPPPPKGPTAPAPQGPVVEGPDCTNLNLVAKDDCDEKGLFDCKEYDGVKKLTSEQGFPVYQVHIKDYPPGVHWDFACVYGRGALYLGFLGLDNRWYPSSDQVYRTTPLQYFEVGPNGVPAWGNMPLGWFTYSLWFDVQ